MKYNLQPLLSYNRVLNFVMGDTGQAASLSLKEYTINQFLKNGDQFIYIRRHKTELKENYSYFKEVLSKFPDHEFRVKGREFHIDGKIAGWAVPLSTWQSEKSNAYPLVTTIVYDDFLSPEPYFGKYLKNEPASLLNLMDTVIRTRDNVRCFCVGKTSEIINPYFIYFGLIPNPGKRFNLNHDLIIEFCKVDKSFNLKNNEMFIADQPNEPIFLFTLNYKGENFGCWYDEEQKTLFISHLYLSQNIVLYVDSLEKIVNRVYLKEFKTEFTIHKIFSLFKQGSVTFHNKYVRSVFYELFKKSLR